MGKKKSFEQSLPLSESSIRKPAIDTESEGHKNPMEPVFLHSNNAKNLNQIVFKTEFFRNDHGSFTNCEESFTEMAEDASTSSSDSECFQKETSKEYFDFNNSFNENLKSNEVKDHETISKTSSGIHANTVNIVDRSDANYIQLFTDAFSLELSKLPLISSIVPDSETEDDLETKSNSLSSVDSAEFEDAIESSKSELTRRSEEVGALKSIKSCKTKTKRERRDKISVGKRVQGNFVNPLTGSFLREIVEEENTVEETICFEEDFLDMSNAHSEEIALETGSSIEDIDYQELSKSIVQQENESNFLDFLRQNDTEYIEALIEVQDLKSLAKKTMLTEKVEKFLNDIISQVVKFVEQEDELHVLRRNIDKRSLFKEIKEAVCAYTLAESYRSFIEHTAVKYFRRRKLYGYISPEKNSTEVRLPAICEWLDKLLGEKVCMTKIIELKENELEKEKIQLEKMYRMEISHFKQVVKNTLKRDGMPHLEEFVERELQRIQVLNEQISVVRESLIKRQHIHGTLNTRINYYEHRGEDFCLADYEYLLRQNFYLEKKIEERNGELNKTMNWLRRNLHILAHTSMRNGVFTSEIIAKTQNLDFISNESFNFRKNMQRLKMERSSIQRKITEISFLSGLEDKPILLKDYDETLERVREKKKAVDELRQLHTKLQQRISHLGIASSKK